MNLAYSYNIAVVEDAAQGVMANYQGAALGSIGDLGTFSFHETKTSQAAVKVNSSCQQIRSCWTF